EKKVIANLKKAGLMIAGAAVQKLMLSLSKEQEILMNIADIIGYVYVAESVMLRAEKLENTQTSEQVKYAKLMAQVYLCSAIDIVHLAGKEALNSVAGRDELNMMLMGLRRFAKAQPFNIRAARQDTAKKLVGGKKYWL